MVKKQGAGCVKLLEVGTTTTKKQASRVAKQELGKELGTQIKTTVS